MPDSGKQGPHKAIGAAIGAVNTLVVALVVAHAVATDHARVDAYAWVFFNDRDTPPWDIAGRLWFFGLPYGVLIGGLAGALESARFSRGLRMFAYPLVGVAGLAVPGLIWPALLIHGVGPTVLFSLLLELATFRPPAYEFPRARLTTS